MVDETKIRQVRQAKGLTLQDVAAKLETSPATVSRWEREPSRVTIPVLINLAAAMDCSVADLLPADKFPERLDYNDTDDPDAKPASAVFSREFLATLTRTPPEQLVVFLIIGDAMDPTLRHGDMCIADTTLRGLNRPGLWAFGRDGQAGVRRIQMSPEPGFVTARSDNPLYQPTHIQREKLPTIGRVIWIGKRV